MGVKTFTQELKVKASPSRLFKALFTESNEVLPKITNYVKHVEVVEGNGTAPGCVHKTHFHDDAPFKHLKNRFDLVDPENYVCKFTTVEGELLGNKVEYVVHEVKFEASGDGGSVVKLKSEYHTTGGYVPSEVEINAAKQQSAAFYKASEEYLLANPQVCA